MKRTLILAALAILALASSTDAGPFRSRGGGCSGSSHASVSACAEGGCDGAAGRRLFGRVRAWLGARRCR